MKRFLLAIMLVLTVVSAYAQTRPYTKVENYFKGTDYELQVYKIYGRQNGPTMLILGGIQGDEPGGFLSADLYSDLRLEKGNLIVIPRANFKSVILYDRGPDGDMNRRFLDEPERLEMDKVVSVVKKLMSESNVFLNLHDGWGYHSPVYVDSNRNPNRFGQSVITDADMYKCGNGKTIDLKSHAMDVLKTVNGKIDDERYHLHYFNTDTANPKTPFSDMRKTATYYAVRQYCIPAYGIESSKNLPSVELKVLYHNYAVNEFMKIYGIVPEVPSIIIDKPRFDYAIIAVNDEPKKIDRGQTLYVNRGDVVELRHIESNYERGVSGDLLGYGTLNDLNSKFIIKNNSVLQFRKDNIKIGNISIAVAKAPKVQPVAEAPKAEPVAEPVKPAAPAVQTPAAGYVFNVKVNGKPLTVANGETLNLSVGTKLELVSLALDGEITGLPINLKGYVPSFSMVNDGDDRGYVINLQPKRFMKKYAEDTAKMLYPVVVTQDRQETAKFWVKMK
ncbi:MAG: M14/M99 family metallopeptidase [Deferribacterales bacterium]